MMVAKGINWYLALWWGWPRLCEGCLVIIVMITKIVIYVIYCGHITTLKSNTSNNWTIQYTYNLSSIVNKIITI